MATIDINEQKSAIFVGLLIMKHQYANLIFISDFIFYLVTFDLQAV